MKTPDAVQEFNEVQMAAYYTMHEYREGNFIPVSMTEFITLQIPRSPLCVNQQQTKDLP